MSKSLNSPETIRFVRALRELQKFLNKHLYVVLALAGVGGLGITAATTGIENAS